MVALDPPVAATCPKLNDKTNIALLADCIWTLNRPDLQLQVAN